MKLNTINLIEHMLTDAVLKADKQFDEQEQAVSVLFESLKAAHGDTKSKAEIEKMLKESGTFKRRKEAFKALQDLERARDDFLEQDWR